MVFFIECIRIFHCHPTGAAGEVRDHCCAGINWVKKKYHIFFVISISPSFVKQIRIDKPVLEFVAPNESEWNGNGNFENETEKEKKHTQTENLLFNNWKRAYLLFDWNTIISLNGCCRVVDEWCRSDGTSNNKIVCNVAYGKKRIVHSFFNVCRTSPFRQKECKQLPK